MFSVLISRPLSNWNLEQTLVSQGIFQYFRGCHDNQLKIYIWFHITHRYQNKRMKLVRNLHVSFFTLDIAWANMRNGWCVFIMSSLMGSYHMSIYHSHRASITVLLQTLPHISDRFSRCINVFFLFLYAMFELLKRIFKRPQRGNSLCILVKRRCEFKGLCE